MDQLLRKAFTFAAPAPAAPPAPAAAPWLPPVTAAGDRRLVLCRHGETELNRLGQPQGRRANPPLNATGHGQAARMAAALAAAGLEGGVHLASSSQLRAVQTADAVATALPRARRVGAFDSLAEIDWGAPVAPSRPKGAKMGDALWASWARGDATAHGDGGESLAAVLARFAACVDKLLADVPPGGALIVVTHSGVLEVVLAAALAALGAAGAGAEGAFGVGTYYHRDDAPWWLRPPQAWNLLAARHLREDNACINVLDLAPSAGLRALVAVPVVGYVAAGAAAGDAAGGGCACHQAHDAPRRRNNAPCQACRERARALADAA